LAGLVGLALEEKAQKWGFWRVDSCGLVEGDDVMMVK